MYLYSIAGIPYLENKALTVRFISNGLIGLKADRTN